MWYVLLVMCLGDVVVDFVFLVPSRRKVKLGDVCLFLRHVRSYSFVWWYSQACLYVVEDFERLHAVECTW